MDRIFKAAQSSAQLTEESKDSQGLIEPFFSFDRLLSLFYANTYHRRAVQLKASLLSNIEDGSKLGGVAL